MNSNQFSPKSGSKPNVVGSSSGAAYRLLNYDSDTGVTLGTYTSIAGRDLGALVTGYDTALKNQIIAALSAGRRVRTSLYILQTFVKTTAGSVATATLVIDLFAPGRNQFSVQSLLTIDQLSSTNILCLSVESTYNGTGFEQSNKMYSVQSQFSPDTADTASTGFLRSAASASVANNADGALVVASLTQTNVTLASSNLLLKGLTIDIVS